MNLTFAGVLQLSDGGFTMVVYDKMYMKAYRNKYYICLNNTAQLYFIFRNADFSSVPKDCFFFTDFPTVLFLRQMYCLLTYTC